MWKYFTKTQLKEYLIDLNLVNGNYTDNKKLNILYAISNNSSKYYTQKVINKKRGGKRVLLIPQYTLKNIQKNLLNKVLRELKISRYATAYIKGISIKDNCQAHINRKIILKIDIKDFFTNITFDKLYRALPNYLFPPAIKVLLLKLCTYDDYLPQGAPTSPYLSNLVMKSFDEYIGKYCQEINVSYTRYCDDLTFSGDFDYVKLLIKVKKCLANMDFEVNNQKTKILFNNHRQLVTGLVVNQKINVVKSYRQRICQEIYYINKFSLDSHLEYLNLDKDKYLSNLYGRLNYALNINPNDKMLNKYKIILENML